MLCKTPCIVKINGEYIGRVGENPVFVDIEEGFFEFIPLENNLLPVNCFVNTNGVCSDKKVKIIDLYGGFLIVPSFSSRVDGEFKIIGRKSLELPRPVSVTCFSQCGIKLLIQTQEDFFVEGIPFTPEDLRIESVSRGKKEYVVLICVGKKSLLLGFCISDKISLVFRSLCDGYSFEKNRLTNHEIKNDTLKHTVTSVWEFAEEVKLVNYLVSAKRQIFSLPEKLIPYAFFEVIMLSADPSDFLTPRLKPRSKELKGFIGDFYRILPPPHFKPDDYITLLYDDKIQYAKLTCEKGLIDNITLFDK